MSKTSFNHILEIVKFRNLIFGRDNPRAGPREKIILVWTLGGAVSYRIHLWYIYQRLIKLEPKDLAQILLHV